jgi:hypothetical protein
LVSPQQVMATHSWRRCRGSDFGWQITRKAVGFPTTGPPTGRAGRHPAAAAGAGRADRRPHRRPAAGAGARRDQAGRERQRAATDNAAANGGGERPQLGGNTRRKGRPRRTDGRGRRLDVGGARWPRFERTLGLCSCAERIWIVKAGPSTGRNTLRSSAR